jgi:hypothetical protein
MALYTQLLALSIGQRHSQRPDGGSIRINNFILGVDVVRQSLPRNRLTLKQTPQIGQKTNGGVLQRCIAPGRWAAYANNLS